MKRTVLLTLALCLLAGSALAEVCLSPYVKRLQGPEKVLYVWSVAAEPAGQDGLALHLRRRRGPGPSPAPADARQPR